MTFCASLAIFSKEHRMPCLILLKFFMFSACLEETAHDSEHEWSDAQRETLHTMELNPKQL